MDHISLSLPSLVVSKTKTNPTYLLAEQIADMTKTKPVRWLRECKQHQWACERALIELKDAKAKKPIALFTYLLKKYKSEC